MFYHVHTGIQYIQRGSYMYHSRCHMEESQLYQSSYIFPGIEYQKIQQDKLHNTVLTLSYKPQASN